MSTKLHSLLEQSLPLKLELSPLENAKGCELANTVYVYFTVIIWFVQCALHTNEPYEYNSLSSDLSVLLNQKV